MKTHLINKPDIMPIKMLPKNIKPPIAAEYYKHVSGTSKKGKFEIYSFYNYANRLIKRISDYNDENGKTKIVTKYKGRFSKSVKLLNGKVESLVKKEYAWRTFNKYLMIKNTVMRNSSKENIEIISLEPQKKQKKIILNTSWDGESPKIDYVNMDKIFEGENGVEYIPVFADRKAFKRYEHIAKYQIKEQGLENIVDSFNVITEDKIAGLNDRMGELHNTVGVNGAFDENTGKVYYVIYDSTFPTEEIDIIAHEIQHAKDDSDYLRLDDSKFNEKNRLFYERSRKEGIITRENSPEKYQNLKKMRLDISNTDYYNECMKGNHDKLDSEASAIRKGEYEAKKASYLWQKMMVYFGFWSK
ncbi:hypothetical protein IJO12_07500 [bacterium]|nr:hypothetical protein [bacterium]